MAWLDLAILITLLAVTGVALFRTRSRMTVVFVSLFSFFYFGIFRHGCVCSVGSIQNVFKAMVDSHYLIPVTVILLFLIPVITALFFGRLFCAGACPLGAVQELVNVRRIKLPQWLDRSLTLLPPLYLALTLLVLLTHNIFLICRIDPFISLFRLDGNFMGTILAVGVILTAMVIPRPYCRFLCPYGFILKIASFTAAKQVKISNDLCRSCRLCYDICPVEAIEPVDKALSVEENMKRVKRQFIQLPLWIILFGGSFGFLGSALVKMKSASPLIESIVPASIVIGIVLGAVWGVTLIFRARGREYKEAFPRRTSCIRCARCFNYCPITEEVQRED